MEEQNLEKDSISQDLPESKKQPGLIVGVIVLIVAFLAVGFYWWLQKDNSSSQLTDNFQQLRNGLVKTGWATYVSDDQYFKIDYPDDWESFDKEGLLFGVAMYKDQQPEASIELKKIEATNKIELQTAFDKQYQNCVEAEGDCESVDIDEFQKIKISGELTRIDTDSKYASGTTILIYLKDYYLSIHLEYENETFLPTIKKIIDSIFIDIESRWNHYYCNREPGVVAIDNYMSGYCYKVKEGDTLWSIAEAYYGVPELWTQLKLHDPEDPHDLSKLSPDDPKALTPGTELVLWTSLQVAFDERTGGGNTDGWGIDFDTSDFFTASSQKIYINKDVYDSGFRWVYRFLIDERTNNKVYVVAPQQEPGESRSDRIYQFVFNKQRNPYVGAGATFELLTFNHDEDKYALRTNVRQGVENPGFMVLSNIGNGPEFDYLDSIIWYDNNTLVYRAQNDDEWRLVVNNQDYKTYGYLENLRVEDGVLKFDYRKGNGSMKVEEVSLDAQEYDAEFTLYSEEIPVGDAFYDYLKSTRSDLSEAELFNIEKNYHYKKGTLVDEFGDLVKDPVELYLDPVSGIGLSEDVGRSTFTAINGHFELFVPEIGPYTLSLQEGWSVENLEEINPVDFRYSIEDYELTVRNEGYDQRVRDEHSKAAEEGDTLWSFAARNYGQGYFWPIIVENNDLNSASADTLLTEGNLYFIVPFEELHFDELFELRKKYHDENVEEIFNIINSEYGYTIDYPACWDAEGLIEGEYDGKKLTIRGPRPAVNPSGKRWPIFNVTVYDSSLSPVDFASSKGYLNHVNLEDEKFSYEVLDTGAVVFKYGEFLVYGSSGLAEIRHQLYVKDDLIYDISYSVHHSIDDVAEEEILDMLDSFRFIDE